MAPVRRERQDVLGEISEDLVEVRRAGRGRAAEAPAQLGR
jgi:hypothetical protein